MVKPSRTKQGLHPRTSVDQARKTERAKELKKHKKERANIRLALAKSGSTNVENIEKLLDLERQLCGLEEPKFHENVLKAKQRNLLANFDKARALFQKSDKPEDKASMDRLNATVKDYYTKCAAIRREADQLLLARSTVVDEIPMPMGMFTTLSALQPMPNDPTNYRSSFSRSCRWDSRRARTPGCPVGIPPELSDSEEDELDDVEVEQNDLGQVFIPVEISRKITPVPPPMPVLMPLRGPSIPPPPLPPLPSAFLQTLSAAPVLNKPEGPPTAEEPPIYGQAVMRDLKGESTRMIPAQLLRAKEKKAPASLRRPLAPARNAQTGKTTDEAYDEFMNELAGLL